MPKEMLINIKSEIKNIDGTKENSEHKLQGKLYFKDGKYFLRYKENTELGDTWTIIHWEKEKPKKVYILRQGDIKNEQIYQVNFTHKSEYRNKYGIINLEIFTQQLIIDYDNEKGLILIKYNLNMNGQKIGKYKLIIKFVTTT